MPNIMRRIIYLVAFMLLYINLSAQEPGIRNFTTYDGLPSNEVFQGLLASNGFMWFATDDGVSKFNGSAFEVFEIKDGLTENTILDVKEDKEKRVWFVGISGRLSYYEDNKIHHFHGNNLIIKNKTDIEIPNPGSLVTYGTKGARLSFISGKTIFIHDTVVEVYHLLQNDSIAISNPHNRYPFYMKIINDDTMSYTVDFDSSSFTVNVPKDFKVGYHSNNYNYLEFDDKIIYFYNRVALIIYKNGDIEITNLKFRPQQSIHSVDKGVWIGTSKNGVMYFPKCEFNKKPLIHFLEDQFVTSLIYDQNQRGWVTTSYGGIYNIQSLYIQNFYKQGNYAENFVSKVLQLEGRNYAFFARNNRVFLSNGFKGQLEELVLEELDDQIAYQVKKHLNKVFVATPTNLIEIPIDFFLLPNHPRKGIKIHKSNGIKDFIIQDSVLWAGGSRGLYYDPNILTGSLYNSIPIDNDHSRILKILSAPDESLDPSYEYFVCQSQEQLFRYRYRFDSDNELEISSQIFQMDTIAFTSNDIIYEEQNNTFIIATKGYGLFFLSPDGVTVLNEKSGLFSNSINVIKKPNDSILLLGTNKGLNIVKITKGAKPKVLISKAITTGDGLKGTEIHDIGHFENYVVVSTNMGISILRIYKLIQRKDEFPIYITSFIVNGEKKKIDGTQPVQLKYLEHNIQFLFDAIDFHDKTGMKYYYRLLGSNNEEWSEINKTNVLYPQLPYGKYEFQVKSKNAYGYPSSNISTVSFEIDQIYYKTNWFRLLITFAILSLITLYIYLFFLRRNILLRNKGILHDFQQISLIRVMNPHFIFNALNSVNSFIVNNRKKDATLYVSEIARLIRKVFDSASQNTITIENEASYLNSYLKLEQRRLKNTFNYLIKFDDNLKDLSIPSFMTQVFVENSIWHGFQDKIEKGALISVTFSINEGKIECEIRDNGIGRKASIKIANKKRSKREKHGIDIVKQRISLLNKRNRSNKLELKILDIYNFDRTRPLGTIVKLQFPKNLINTAKD